MSSQKTLNKSGLSHVPSINKYPFTIFSFFRIVHVSQKNEKEQVHTIEQEEKEITTKQMIVFSVCGVLLAFLPLVLIGELDSLYKGQYPIYFKNNSRTEALGVFLYTVAVLIICIQAFYMEIKKRLDFSKIFMGGGFYFSIRLKNFIIRHSFPGDKASLQDIHRLIMGFLRFYFCIIIMLIIE